MKKTIPIILIAGASLFLLAGCNTMLETIFPSQTGPVASNNSFSVAVGANPADHTGWSSTKAYVDVYNWDTNASYQTNVASFVGASTDPYVYGSVSFNSVPNGNYYGFVWYDTNGNGGYDSGEPAAYVPGPIGSYFALSSVSSTASYDVYFY